MGSLIAAAVVWAYAGNVAGGMTTELMVSIVSLAAGALFANVVSVVLLVIETATLSRH